MTTKQLLRIYDALSGALASLQSSPRASRTEAVAAVRRRAVDLMAAIDLASARTSRDAVAMAERLVDKATVAVNASAPQLPALEDELAEVTKLRDRLYWAFTRGKTSPPVPAEVTRRFYALTEAVRVAKFQA